MKAIDYCEKIFDGTHDSPKPNAEGKHYLINSKNISTGQIDYNGAYKISDDDYNKIIKRSGVKKGDILISMIGTIGNLCIVDDDSPDYAIKNMGVFRCKNSVDRNKLFYYLQTNDFKQKSNNFLNSSIQKFLTLDFIRNLDIQKEILDKIDVDKLTRVDLLIKHNNDVINVLINKIKDIYSFYFENSKLSNCDKNYFDSFSGCYLPLGWKYENLGKYIDGITTGLNPRANFVLNNGGKIPYVTIKNIEDNGINLKKCDYIDMDAFNKIQNRSKLKNGDILYTSLSPAGLTYFLLSWKNEFQINESVFCIKTNDCKLNKYYLYTALNTNSFKKYENNFVNGSNQKSIKQDQILDLKILIASKELIDKFSNKVQSLYLEIDKLQRQNTILSSYKHEILNFLVKKLV